MPDEIDLNDEELEALENAWKDIRRDLGGKDSLGLSYHKGLSSLNETAGGALAPPAGQKRRLKPQAFKGGKRLHPPKVGESFFAHCDRDEEGHCLPSGESKPQAPFLAKEMVQVVPGVFVDAKTAGDVAQLKQAVKDVAAKLGGKIWAKIPPEQQKPLAFCWDLGRKLLARLDEGYEAGQQFAKAVAQARGLPEQHIETVGRIITAADTVSRWAVNWQGADHLLAPLGGPIALAGAKASYYVPTASLAWVAWQLSHEAVKGRNPFATIKRARELMRQQGHKSLGGSMDKETFTMEVCKRLEQAGKRSWWYEALVHAGLDETGNGYAETLRRADVVFASSNAE